MSLLSLPESVLKIVLLYVGNVNDFRSLQQTCSILNRVLLDDDSLWKVCRLQSSEHVYTGVTSHRESACLDQAVANAQLAMDESHNVIPKVLGTSRWRQLVCDIGRNFFEEVSFRGDTLFTLAELTQTYLVDTLQHANRLCIYATTRHSSQAYPELTDHDIKQFARLQSGSEGYDLVALNTDLMRWLYENSFWPLESSQKDKLVRGIAYRAGVIKLTKEAYNEVWENLVKLVYEIVGPASQECHCIIKALRYRSLDPETIDIHEIPPPPYREYFGPLVTPVPQQIENAGRHLDIPVIRNGVYGKGWLVSEGSTEEEEIAAAKASYTVEEESSSWEEDEFDDDEDDSDDSFSVYDDEECEDDSDDSSAGHNDEE